MPCKLSQTRRKQGNLSNVQLRVNIQPAEMGTMMFSWKTELEQEVQLAKKLNRLLHSSYTSAALATREIINTEVN